MTELIGRINRVEQSKDGAIGVLSLFDQILCSTLEPDDQDPERNQIPPGIYFCKRRDSPQAKYPHTFEIMVPGHTDVLYHWGNKEDNTLMCVLLGVYLPWQPTLDGRRALYSSKKTFNIFMEKLAGIDWFYAQFINSY